MRGSLALPRSSMPSNKARLPPVAVPRGGTVAPLPSLSPGCGALFSGTETGVGPSKPSPSRPVPFLPLLPLPGFSTEKPARGSAPGFSTEKPGREGPLRASRPRSPREGPWSYIPWPYPTLPPWASRSSNEKAKSGTAGGTPGILGQQRRVSL